MLPEVGRVGDRVGIVREGRLITVEHVAHLQERALRRIGIRFETQVPEDAFAGVPGISALHVETNNVHCAMAGNLDPLIKAIASFTVVDLISHEPSLEEVFLAFYGADEKDAE